jgi:hypothetical protein
VVVVWRVATPVAPAMPRGCGGGDGAASAGAGAGAGAGDVQCHKRIESKKQKRTCRPN